MDKETAKNLAMMNFMMKAILKKVYDLSDRQYKRVINAFERDSEEVAEKYIQGVNERKKFMEILEEYLGGK